MLQPLIDWLYGLPFVQWLMKLAPRFHTAFVEADRWQMYLKGLVVTFEITLVSIAMGLVLGLFVAMVRTAHDQQRPGRRNPALGLVNLICKVYATVIRGTPMMVQAVFLYYLLKPALGWNPMVAGVCIISVNTGAYMAEIIRAGIQSVDRGQTEAARSIGMSAMQTMFIVVLPQAVKNSFPAIGNEFVVNIKDSSVLSAISVTDLFFQSNGVAGSLFLYTETMAVTALIYLVLTFTTTRILGAIEHRMGRPRSSFPASQTIPGGVSPADGGAAPGGVAPAGTP